MTDKITGREIKDYRDIDLNGLAEIIALDNQLIEIMQEKLEATAKHRDYAQYVLDEKLTLLECHEASTHFEDYMNPPEKNHFADGFGKMLTPSGTRREE